MATKIRRADALREMETREKSNGRAARFSVQFYLKNGELVSFPRAVMRGLKADMKRNRLRGIQPVDSEGNPIGHIHAVSASCGWSTPELYEIWDGEAVIYMQERAEDDPGRCFAVRAKAGDVVVVPPYWAHATVSADPTHPLTFGAWCVRDFGFDYRGVRAHGGIAFFPLFDADGTLRWEKNAAYGGCRLVEKSPELYPQLGIERGESVYSQFVRDNDRFLWVARPMLKEDEWKGFMP